MYIQQHTSRHIYTVLHLLDIEIIMQGLTHKFVRRKQYCIYRQRTQNGCTNTSIQVLEPKFSIYADNNSNKRFFLRRGRKFRHLNFCLSNI